MSFHHTSKEGISASSVSGGIVEKKIPQCGRIARQ
jgi:hypothetical protein